MAHELLIGAAMKRTSMLVVLSALIALLAAACGSDAVPLSPTTSSQRTREGWTIGESPVVLLLVVDDADTPDAAALRARAVEALRGALDGYMDLRWGSCGSSDPAEWHPGDIRVVVARPSAPEGAQLLTPLDVPALGWITQESTQEEVDAVVAAVTQALGERLAAPGEPYRPLRTAKRAIDLLAGARPPEGDAEAALVASLADGRIYEMLVASTRDDEDSAPVADLVPSDAALLSTYIRPTVVASSAGNTICEIHDAGSSRIEQWSELSSSPLYAWPCDEQSTWDSMLYPGVADCYPYCATDPILVDESGVADCRILIDQPDIDQCDPERGFRDPEGEPTLVEREGISLRRCEVAQLEGADLDSCRHSLDCSGCPSGFCVTEVPELTELYECREGGYGWPLRFIGGSRAVWPAWLSITCSTE